jgi:peptidoglycan/xylan/chitin deacetylase (PgdA/CDA1 family)
MLESKGSFTISLDLELHWGVCSRLSINQYRKNLDGTRDAIDKMLLLFEKYDIHTTWATVGILFCQDIVELRQISSSLKPVFIKTKYSSYEYFNQVGNNETSDPYHYGRSIIDKIRKTNYQEIASHTFSHLFFLEEGITHYDIRQDLELAIEIAKKENIYLESIVFPRNQYDSSALDVVRNVGFNNYRGVTPGFLYQSRSREKEKILIKALRLLDAYINISGFNTVVSKFDSNGLVNIPASRFLRPYSTRLRWLDSIRLNRICDGMSKAAMTNRIYHLWWHPHNFGKNTNENIDFLEKILQHFALLNLEYGMQSKSMNEFK